MSGWPELAKENAKSVHELLATIAALEKRIEELEAVVAWANNSLYGSHGPFLSLDGGPADPHHLDTAIERLKADAREATAERQRREEAERALAELRESTALPL